MELVVVMSPSLFAAAWSLPPSFRPQGRPPFPRPLPCFLAPAMSRQPLLSAPALACCCPLFFFLLFPASRLSPRRFGLSSAPPHVPLLSPRCPHLLLGWVEG